jgi:hypothetical protein
MAAGIMRPISIHCVAAGRNADAKNASAARRAGFAAPSGVFLILNPNF